MKTFLILTSFMLTIGATAQVAPSKIEKANLSVERTTIPNFLDDPEVTGSRPDERKNLRSIFIIKSETTGQTIYWSTKFCRMIAITAGDFEELREIKAAGPHPMAESMGARGEPKFFGMRIVDGAPEFLYVYGSLSVEEKYSLAKSGSMMVQSFKISTAARNGSYKVPQGWREFIKGDNGKWDDHTLLLHRTQMNAGFNFTYNLVATLPTEEKSELDLGE